MARKLLRGALFDQRMQPLIGGGFDSGQPELDEWLRRSAASSDSRNITRTHVWKQRNDQRRRVVAYYTTMPYMIERETSTEKEGRGLTDHIPCYLLARLALDQSLHGQQLGSALLADALRRMAISSAGVGRRLIVVDAIDNHAASFYQHHGFEPLKRPDIVSLPHLTAERDRL